MKAAIYPGKGQPVVITTLPDPEPGEGELLIRVHRCGICGTDISMTRGELWDFPANSQIGHEYAGEIVAIGAGVSGLRRGDRVAVLPSQACGHCAACDHGNHTLCRNAGGLMVGFAEYAKVPAYLAVRLPSVLSMADGALVEPLAVSLYGVRQSGLHAGEPVLVLGGGTVALYAIYWARRMGAGRIVAMSRSGRRRELSLAMGADAFVAFSGDEADALREAFGGASPSMVYECVGVPGMLERAVRHVAPFGRIVSLGFCTSPDPLSPAVASYKCATLQFLVGYTLSEFEYVAGQMDKGSVDPKTIITHTAPLDELPAMMTRLRSPNDDTKIQIIC
jgi:(R,R)-butanediol dehydrogenase/meso-butanediol dehydrogenase/diacetyl reductase